MGKQVLILTTVSGFLEKFEVGDVRILQRMGYTIHYAANMREQHYLFREKDLEEMQIVAHHIDVERSPYMFRENRKAFRQILEIIDTCDIGVIHCHTPVGGVLGRMAGRYYKKRNLKVIYTAHGFHFYRGAPLINNTIYYMVEKILARYTDILITINEEDYVSARKFRLKPGGRVYKIPGVGLDTQHFQPLSESERKAKRNELGVQDKFFMVTTGELNENKNQRLILQALQKMRKDGEDISYIVYGVCGDGFFYSRMERWIKEMGLEKQVKLYGYQMDVRNIVGSADCFLFPSKREGLGMAALEALSMGVPAVVSDNRGTREYIHHMDNGYVCSEGKAEGFIRGIHYMMSLDGKKRKRMKRRCRDSVKGFAQDGVLKIMEKIYREMESDEEEDIGPHGGVQP